MDDEQIWRNRQAKATKLIAVLLLVGVHDVEQVWKLSDEDWAKAAIAANTTTPSPLTRQLVIAGITALLKTAKIGPKSAPNKGLTTGSKIKYTRGVPGR